MLKALGLILVLLAMYIGLQIYTEGMEKSVYGSYEALEPAEGESADSALSDTIRTDDPVSGDPALRQRPVAREPITTRVRERVNAHIARGAARYEDR